ITLDGLYSVIHVGLPYVCDLQTLSIDTVSGQSLTDKKILINKMNLMVERSSGIFAESEIPPGDDATEGLYELKIREDESMDDPVALATGPVEIVIDSSWRSGGECVIRQVDPLPCSILSVTPSGVIGGR